MAVDVPGPSGFHKGTEIVCYRGTKTQAALTNGLHSLCEMKSSSSWLSPKGSVLFLANKMQDNM